MKVMIAQGMMENYRKNEKPDIKQLDSLIEAYKELIEATKENTE